jgi:metal-dependent amidase/aminoacylase/carboxypeptidase family protein
VTRLQGIVAREVPPAETAVVTVGRLQAGTKDNIIPDTAGLGINIRTYSPQTRDPGPRRGRAHHRRRGRRQCRAAPGMTPASRQAGFTRSG